MKKFFEKIENLNISFGNILLMFFCAIFLRTFLENFTNSNNVGMMNGFVDTFLNYPLGFLFIFIGVPAVVSIFSEKPISKIFKLASFSSFIILLPTIIDLIVYRHKIIYNFVTGTWLEIVKYYFTLLMTTNAIGVGIKTEVVIVLVAIFYFVYLQKKNILKAFLATWISYSIIFGMLILPNIFYFIAGFFSTLPSVSQETLQNYFLSITLIETSRAYLSDALFGGIRFSAFQNACSILLAQASLYICLLFTILSSFLYFGKNKILQILKNFRWLRIIHYFFLLVFGMIFGLKEISLPLVFSNPSDYLSLSLLFMSLLLAWLFAVWENDEVDKEIDTLSNPDRPLVGNNFSVEEWKNMKWTFFVSSLIFAVLSGYSSLILILVYTVIYHLYSADPFRLKRFPIISSLLIGINACVAFLLGFLFVSGDQPFNILPEGVLLGVLILYTCIENIKNLKDIEGDKVENILTLPVIFGEKKGKFITWVLVFLGTLAIPLLIFPDNKVFLLSPILGAVTYFFIVRKDYKEKPLMIFYLFSFSLILILSLFY
jgi:4-hydroxybenzoate polyprenyltransferase